MKKLILILPFMMIAYNLFAPPNCEVYKHHKKCYQACQEAMKAIRYKQGSYESQQHFDKSIELCDFAYSYQEKAVPYLKRGQFIEWKRLIDKAVELSPKEYLGYRGWCRLQFLRDYKGAIHDIEELKKLVAYDIGPCQTGDYHLNIALALAYKEIGNIEKSRQLFEEHLIEKVSSPDLFDYYHWGVLEFQEGNYEIALTHLKKQQKINGDLAETDYFIALTHNKLKNMALYESYLSKAEEKYKNGNIRSDTYCETFDKIYLSDILNEKESITK